MKDAAQIVYGVFSTLGLLTYTDFSRSSLESYYKGIRSSQISNKGSTKYKWGFAKNIAKEDQNQVDSVRDSIDTMTNIRFANEVSRQTGVSTASSLGGSSSSMGPPKRPGPSMSQAPGPRWPRTADEGKNNERTYWHGNQHSEKKTR